VKKGDIILIPFPFTDLTGSKRRPASILKVGKLDVTVSFISTQLHQQKFSDFLLEPNENNALKKDSVVRIGKIATIDKSLVIGKLGNLSTYEIKELDNMLIQIFDIDR
jgi:mRNA interferase MazF